MTIRPARIPDDVPAVRDLFIEYAASLGFSLCFQNFDAALNTPQFVDKRLVYMTPEWKDAFLFTTKLADQLGLEEAI